MVLVGLLVCAILAKGLDLLFPLHLPHGPGAFSVTVVDEEGEPLRIFPDAKGVWRYPISLEEVSPLYIESLLAYEDRYFYRHPGVNPLALGRALLAALKHGRIVSGGSTLTMQVARIFHPHKKTLSGKLVQMLRALQLEWHLSKDEILTLYINHAPFGGMVEGVEAAALTYLGKSSAELTRAEAAFFAVMPQAPSKNRPDRHLSRSVASRNKVLGRLALQGVISPQEAREAMAEPLSVVSWSPPFRAPLLARRLKKGFPEKAIIETFISPALQAGVSELILNMKAELPSGCSVAVMVMENGTGKVKAYKGSMDFLDKTRFGSVDMARALRSPGSTLKPFLYGLALDEGMIHSDSLLMDVPTSINGYTPLNFSRHFSGPVSASESLVRSLNVPAVSLLDRVGPARFDAFLRQAGIHLRYPQGGEPNLAMILGGAGTTLEELVEGYASLGNGGVPVHPVYVKTDEKRAKGALFSKGAAWIVKRVLSEFQELNATMGRRQGGRVAIKTGTSYGYRDAWALGVTEGHTLGVWVGRPDGTPLPGHYGAVTAVPLLRRVAGLLPRKGGRLSVPDDVEKKMICWPLGGLAKETEEGLCHEVREAWVLKGMVPPTFADVGVGGIAIDNPVRLWVSESGKGLYGACLDRYLEKGGKARKICIARWPAGAAPFLPPWKRQKGRLPAPHGLCLPHEQGPGSTIQITGIQDGGILKDPLGRKGSLSTSLSAIGGRGELLWMVDHKLVAKSQSGSQVSVTFPFAGRFTLTVMDTSGDYAEVNLTVR